MMTKLEEAFKLFDDYNKRAPEMVTWDGVICPSEYFYALKLYDWVKKLEPEASEELLLASRSQHIGRWEVPRNTYPEGRVGYLKWRSDLGKFHADKAGLILEEVGYDHDPIDRVKDIIQKKRLKTDTEVQTIENALCLVFLEYQFEDIIEKFEEEKVIDIVRKTWAKMTEAGHKEALLLQYSDRGIGIVRKALNISN